MRRPRVAVLNCRETVREGTVCVAPGRVGAVRNAPSPAAAKLAKGSETKPASSERRDTCGVAAAASDESERRAELNRGSIERTNRTEREGTEIAAACALVRSVHRRTSRSRHSWKQLHQESNSIRSRQPCARQHQALINRIGRRSRQTSSRRPCVPQSSQVV